MSRGGFGLGKEDRCALNYFWGHISDLLKARVMKLVQFFLISQRVGAHLNDMETNPPIQLHYFQFASLY